MNPVNMIMTGDVNLMNVTDPAVPFAQVAHEFRNTDVVFSNLECCLYEPPAGHSVRNEGFFADPKSGKALKLGGIQVGGHRQQRALWGRRHSVLDRATG